MGNMAVEESNLEGKKDIIGKKLVAAPGGGTPPKALKKLAAPGATLGAWQWVAFEK